MFFIVRLSPKRLFESGLDEKSQEDIRSTLTSNFDYKLKIFRSKQDYIDKNSGSSNLNLNYIEDSFQLYLVANLIMIVLFILILFLKKNKFVFYKTYFLILSFRTYLISIMRRAI